MLDHFRKLLKLDEPNISFRPRVICEDGFSISIQAGQGLYCHPRNYDGNYTKVELGFPSDYEEDILQYAESFGEFDDPRETVYPYVPVEVIFKALQKHGEIKLINDNFSVLPEHLRELYKLF